MAAKTRPARLESEIEKCRGDGNWARVLDLSKQISVKSSNLEYLIKFVQAECKLERFLLEHPPNESNIELASSQLLEVQTEMEAVLAANPKADMKQEINLLLAKIRYAVGDYQGTLEKLDQVPLDGISLTDVSSRKLKIIGESFAIKGLCLEKLPPLTSRYKQAEREELIIQCFERSGDLSLLQLQERQERGAKATTAVAIQSSGMWNIMDSDTVGVGPIVETAIQRSPILYIRNGELSKGIGRFRELLRAVEARSIQGLRQTLARQLAEVLLRGVCESTYEPINLSDNQVDVTENPFPKPRKYSGDRASFFYASRCSSGFCTRKICADKTCYGPLYSSILFVPKDESEETLLLLLISESIATRDAVLNRSSELTDARLHTFHKTTAVYDLLTIALVRRSQFAMLSETFERAMKFSFNEFHIWYQLALSLICSEKYTRAFLVLKECMKLNPNDPVIYLLAAKLCYEYLNLVSEGVKYSQNVVDMPGSHPLVARGYLFLGIGFSLRSDEVRLQTERQSNQRKAIDALSRAVSLDTNDYLAYFHLALQMALLRQISEALTYVRKALHLRRDHLQSLHLLALLLSAQKQHEEAYRLVEAALVEHPDSFSLLFTKCKLESEVQTVETALQTCRQMLQLWKNLYEATIDSEERGTGLLERITTDHRSLLQLQLYEVSDRDSGSIRAESVAASRLEQTLSEVASSIGSSTQPKPGPQHSWMLQTQIWLLLAELYLKLELYDSAYACIQEAGNVCPMSHVVSYMRGRYYEAKGDLKEARKLYENAIAINPAHIKSLHRLGVVLYVMGNYRLAEKVLRDAVNYDPTSSQSWFSFGKVLQSLGDFQIAADCLTTALELEATNPILPFSVVGKTFY